MSAFSAYLNRFKKYVGTRILYYVKRCEEKMSHSADSAVIAFTESTQSAQNFQLAVMKELKQSSLNQISLN